MKLNPVAIMFWFVLSLLGYVLFGTLKAAAIGYIIGFSISISISFLLVFIKTNIR
jgi:hypothetical protein